MAKIDADVMAPEFKITYQVSRCYLEFARAALASQSVPENIAAEPREAMNIEANIQLPLLASTVLFSYFALESYVNYQLSNLRAISKDQNSKTTKSGRRLSRERGGSVLGNRLDELCRWIGCLTVSESSPKLWSDFIGLAETARNFMSHSNPREFEAAMRRIMTTPAGLYVNTAQGILEHFYVGFPPKWLSKNTLIRQMTIEGFSATEHSGLGTSNRI